MIRPGLLTPYWISAYEVTGESSYYKNRVNLIVLNNQGEGEYHNPGYGSTRENKSHGPKPRL
jgi:hypothetical protein